MSKSKFYGKTVIVTKAVDESGNHPKDVNEGDTFEGRLIQFEVGYSAFIEIDSNHSFRSSTISLIDEDSGIFQTKNSIYKIELHPTQVDYCELIKDMFIKDMEKEDAIEAPHYNVEPAVGMGGADEAIGGYERFYEERGNVNHGPAEGAADPGPGQGR